MSKLEVRNGAKFGKWTLERFLAPGGNGRVWRAKADDDQLGAIKFLKQPDSTKANKRFKHEIAAMARCQGIVGILPLLDFYSPDMPTAADPAWFVSALATPLDESRDFEEETCLG
jgi:serine/threonine protein kinase